jgi:flagellar protein FliL
MTTMTREPAAAEAVEEKKGGPLKLVVILLVVVLVAGGAAYWFILKPKNAEPAKPKPGTVVALDPIQVNLADGHYLSIGIALQAVDGVKEVDGSKALDATIEEFSGLPIDQLLKAKEREHLKEELVKSLEKLYDDEVMDVYFTQFVTQ